MAGLEDALFSLYEKKDEIQQWLDKKRETIPLPIYGSFDVRDAGWKAVVVDSNAFPAGFNNLDPKDHLELSFRMKKWFENLDTPPKRILLWPEAHTRNPGYLENVSLIKSLIDRTGIEVLVGTDLLNSQTISTPEGDLSYIDVDVTDELVLADGKSVDMIFLNSDLSDG
ncbi:MAG: glutamate--cysteine ligase, partial [Candidatus Thermoplasmatota archaeon]|nr:glutamate--cysteine ligase [Candidatus Thermoplasmatota archaeon]